MSAPRTGSDTAERREGRPAIPRAVWVLGFVSLFMDVSSEMIHAVLPLFLTSALGASVLWVGWIEGIAEATASITKIFSGALSDALGQRKLLAAVGYGLGALSKPIFPLAASSGWIAAARFVDRIGKGIRGAPRDALVADLAPPELRGASYGLRQSLDTIGAFAGPLLAVSILALGSGGLRLVLWIAVVPAFIAVALVVFGVRDPQRSASRPTWRFRSPIARAELRRLDAPYWQLVLVGACLTLARFSEAFLILRAQSVGLSAALAPLALVIMNLAYTLSSYPAGWLSDRVNRRAVLAAGIAVLAVSQLVLASSVGVVSLAVGVALWGLHMGLTQGLFAALVADRAPPELRGTAFGVFHLVGGIALLIGSAAAGWLWDREGPAAAFFAGAVCAVLALAALLALKKPQVKPA